MGDNVRKVPKSMAEEFAKSKNVPFLEASALSTINVREAFMKVAHDLMEKTQQKKNSGFMGKMCGCTLI